MTLAEYDQRWNALLAVWQALHRATDTPESAAAVRGLNAALRALGQYAALDGGGRGAEDAAYGLLDVLRVDGLLAADEVDALKTLAPQAREVSRFTEYSEERDRANVNLVSRCLPALWRIVNLEQDALRARRPRGFHARRARRVAAGAAVIFAAWVVLQGVLIAAGLLRSTGWRVTYFYSIDFQRPMAVRGEPALSLDYGGRAPAFPIRRDRWSARWEGRLVVPETASYTFVVQGNDGYRFYLGSELVADSWRVQSWRGSVRKISLDLKAGVYPVRVEHFDDTGDAAIRIRWAGGPVPRDTALGAPYILKP
ncbi:MAG TPA: PA14 domain-containing protein [Kiritimatiellia bacterium]|nr:PA14 domain-containing protein [Kiritimatiellia bacterium]